jgi:hypothetical protein
VLLLLLGPLSQKELMDPEKLKAREAKFGKPLLKVGGGKEPITSTEALKKRAERFGVATKPTGDDEARKKVRVRYTLKGLQ